MIMRTYTALYGATEYEFQSEHKAGSQANMDDARAAARRRFGKLHNTISNIHLTPEVTEKPLGTPVKNLSLTDDERDALLKGFADGVLTRAYAGAKVDGLVAFAHIKNAHGWSWNDFRRAVSELR